MKRKSEIKDRIKRFRIQRDDAKQYSDTEGIVFWLDGAIKTMEWVLGYKTNIYWCFQCARLHKGLKCPKCGNVVLHPIGNKIKKGKDGKYPPD